MNQAYGNTHLGRWLLRIVSIVDALVLFVSCCSTAAGLANLVWLVVVLALFNAVIGVYAISQGVIFEFRLERIWKGVCSGVGFEGEARSYRNGLVGAYGKGETKTIYPRLRNVRGNREGWTGIVLPFMGQTIDDYNKEAKAFAQAYHVPFVSFDITENGLFRIRAGRVPVPEPYEYTVPVERIPGRQNKPVRGEMLPVSHIYEAEAQALLQGVPMAVDIDGRECRIPIEGQHLLIAGRSGSGKGSWIWALVCSLAPAWRERMVRFWAADPKHIELAIEPRWWYRYADSDVDIVDMLEDCVSDMITRARLLQGKARKFTPSIETPLNIIIIDELGYLVAYITDRKLKERAVNAISSLLVMGRANGYAVVGAVQDPRKESVGFRDLFQTRIALGLPVQMVDLVLGEGMHDAGALCEQIPLGQAGQGAGYAISETSLRPVCLRPAWYSDEAIRAALYGRTVRPLPQGQVVPQLGFDGQSQLRYRVE
jgi:DNA segregation ATPase FtsK/SpoIIIE, S-DNA-T family